MAFERHISFGRQDRPMLTVSKTGVLSLNRAARALYHLDSYRKVVLFYDAATRRIGLGFTLDVDEQGARTVSRSGEVLLIQGQRFLLAYDLWPRVTARYPLRQEQTEQGLLLVADVGPNGAEKERK